MNMPFVLWLVAVVAIAMGVGAFFWASHRGQSDDSRPPAWWAPGEEEPMSRVHHRGGQPARKG